MHVMRGGAAGAPDGGDRVARRHPHADLDQVLLVVSVNRQEAVIMLDLHDAAIARLHRAHDHRAVGGGEDDRPRARP